MNHEFPLKNQTYSKRTKINIFHKYGGVRLINKSYFSIIDKTTVASCLKVSKKELACL